MPVTICQPMAATRSPLLRVCKSWQLLVTICNRHFLARDLQSFFEIKQRTEIAHKKKGRFAYKVLLT